MTNFDKLREKLAEMFQLDRADLDFGIYRIMNSKRDEILDFLDKDLLPQVKQVLQQAQGEHAIYDRSELEEAEAQARSLGLDPDTVPKVVALREKSKSGLDMFAMEEEVFNHLYSFFRRYYSEGDFLSLRRYKEGVYAIPYEGEEVKLHWANADQYYIKTAENFRDYAFKVGDGKRVHFRLVDAQTERDNNKAQEKRFFILVEQDPVAEIDGELQIRFEYRQPTAKTSQADLTAEAEAVVLTCATAEWAKLLQEKAPTEKSPNRTVLAKHLSDYTARNTFDYFIHKDLGKFLRRELDFYIKNEVMHLDDIENESAPRVEQYLTKIRAIRRVAEKLIIFLAQLEDFQKRLWLKKKFVVGTQYLVTLKLVPEALLAEIAGNEAQRNEWVSLFAIDEIKPDLQTPGFSIDLSVEFLRAHPTLILDTHNFDPGFTERLLTAFGDLDEQTDGILIQSDNFQGLHFITNRDRQAIDFIYIDPPYNTDATEIIYKNGYKESSWLALISSRLRLGRFLLRPHGVHCLTIDDYEHAKARLVLDNEFRNENYLATVLIRNNPSGRSTVKGFSVNHEFALFYGVESTRTKVGRLPHSEEQKERYDEKDDDGAFEWENFRKSSAGSDRASRPKQHFPAFVHEDTLSIRIPRLSWTDPTKKYEVLEATHENEIAVWPVDESGTQKVWRWGLERTQFNLGSLEARRQGAKIELYGHKYINDQGVLPRTWWDKPEYSARDNGTRTLREMFRSDPGFDFPKAVSAVKDSIRIGCPSEAGVVLDYFGGSGTTAHAVIELNVSDGAQRKFILFEAGGHFDSVLLPRTKRATYTPDWKSGKPKRLATLEESERTPRIVKIFRLESYEDTLANLQFAKRSPAQQQLLEEDEVLREDYLLRYVLDAETAGSQSTLNIQQFAHPFAYKLKVATDSVGETKEVNVDLVETFNWLLGLRVKTMDTIRGFRIIDGTNPADERVLVIWRDLVENPNEKLDEFFRKQAYNTLDQVYDVIYVNGDNNLQNLRKEDQTWKVRLIEEEFHRLMWDVEDV